MTLYELLFPTGWRRKSPVKWGCVTVTKTRYVAEYMMKSPRARAGMAVRRLAISLYCHSKGRYIFDILPDNVPVGAFAPAD
jgi:hypothetical protein